MHPGWTETEGLKVAMPGFVSAFQRSLRNLAQGADTIVWLLLCDAAALQPGAFYFDRAPNAKHLAFGGTKYTSEQVDALWERLQAMCSSGGQLQQ